MADTMQFDLVSPERNLVSVPVREVRLPGTEGDLTAMPGHAPAIVNLRPGIVTLVTADGAETEFAVTGGFVEINNESVSLLAERGHPRAEMTQAGVEGSSLASRNTELRLAEENYTFQTLMVQQALANGPAEITVGSMTTTDPIVAVSFGLVVLGEGVHITPLAAVGMVIAGALSVWGVVQLSRHHPDAARPVSAPASQPDPVVT